MDERSQLLEHMITDQCDVEPGQRTFRLTTPLTLEFGKFVAHDEMRLLSTCPVCGTERYERKFPSRIEYLGGIVADFHSASKLLIARRAVAEELAERFKGIAVKEIEMYSGESFWSDPDKRPQTAKKYNGPELAELCFPFNIPGDPTLSSLVETFRCDECHTRHYLVKGVERISLDEPSDLFFEGLNYHRSPEWVSG